MVHYEQKAGWDTKLVWSAWPPGREINGHSIHNRKTLICKC
jgi:hypothetical protein